MEHVRRLLIIRSFQIMHYRDGEFFDTIKLIWSHPELRHLDGLVELKDSILAWKNDVRPFLDDRNLIFREANLFYQLYDQGLNILEQLEHFLANHNEVIVYLSSFQKNRIHCIR